MVLISSLGSLRGHSAPAFGASLLIAASLFAAPGADEPSLGFTFCVAPRPPGCIDTPSQPEPIEDCERRVRVYVANVTRYRECLQAETARHVRRANDALDKVRCMESKNCRR